LGSPVVITIAQSVADELAFGVDRKFGCNAIASPSKTDKIALFRFTHKVIAFSSYSAQAKVIANSSQSNTITFTVMDKSDHQPKPNACDWALLIQAAQISL
jgi:hypothetical protein